MVRIVTDTTACLPKGFVEQYDITILPQVIHFGTESYLEGVEIDSAMFMQRLTATRDLPRTAAPAPELFATEFERLLSYGEPILCLHPSAEVSGTVRSAQLAANEFPNRDIHVLDTRLVGSPMGTLVVLAAEWAVAGRMVGEIEARLREMIPRGRVYFLVPTLAYLARGGRIGGAAALLGSALQIKPILTLQNGRVEQLRRERTQARALARLKELVLQEYPPTETGYLSVMHGGVSEQAQSLANDLCAHLGLAVVPVVDAPPAIVVHSGPGLLGVGFFGSADTDRGSSTVPV